MRIKFWGTRGSIPVPGKETTLFGGNTTCLEIILNNGKRVIVDAGTGIRPLGEYLVSSRKDLNLTLLVTHIHWDHVIGFPFFPPIYDSSAKIEIDGSVNCMKGLKYIFDNKMGDGFFPIRFDGLKAEIFHRDEIRKGPIEIDGTTVESVPLQHPQGGYGFRFREGGKSLVFITDNELTEKAWKGSHPEDFEDFCRDADILIHDAQYLPEEIGERRGWGHSDYESALDLALNSGVEKLILFHHDPSRTDKQLGVLLEKCRESAIRKKSDLSIDAAREGSDFIL